jgi:hypothetical protein
MLVVTFLMMICWSYQALQKESPLAHSAEAGGSPTYLGLQTYGLASPALRGHGGLSACGKRGLRTAGFSPVEQGSKRSEMPIN